MSGVLGGTDALGVVVAVGTTMALWPALPAAVDAGRGPRPAGRDEAGGEDAAVATAAELVAGCLRTGLPPDRALAAALQAMPVREPVARALAAAHEMAVAGTGVGTAIGRAAGHAPALAPLAAAWQVTERLGAPLAPALEAVARSARERAATRDRLDTELAGARASMWLLTLLPLLGPVAVLAVGLDPAAVYLTSPAGRGCALAGVALTAAGWLVARTLVRRSARPARLPERR